MGDALIAVGITLIIASLLLGPGLEAFRKFLQRMFRF